MNQHQSSRCFLIPTLRLQPGSEREWARMKANDSQECRNCHNFDYMDFSEQSARAIESHTKAFLGTDKMLPTGETCIDCHKGIAHELPNMHGIEGW